MPLLTEQQLEASFQDRSIHRGGEQYFDLRTACAYIDACAANDLAIIGIEGFVLENDTLRPRMDLIADFSDLLAPTWSDFRDRTTSAARQFMSQVTDRQLIFSLTAFTRSEWESRG